MEKNPHFLSHQGHGIIFAEAEVVKPKREGDVGTGRFTLG
jgi:hypothetical protein